MLKILSRGIIITLLFSLNQACQPSEKEDGTTLFITLLGYEKTYPEPSEKALEAYETALKNYHEDPDNLENIIWLGRRTAYLARYQEAIEIYTAGLNKYPNNPKLYRHRGHRYISIREYNKAIADLEKAAQLIQGTENEIEADGLPNARNIPVSSLHGNIYYHLGLAYYLIHEYERAYEAYMNCRNSANNPDNIVSSTHWLYMIQRRLGHEALADSMLVPIKTDFDVIENHDYYKLCKFYKKLTPEDSLAISGDSPGSDALKYGLANWHFYNGQKAEAEEIFKAMMSGNSWTSFGYLAAESDLLKYFPDANQP